MKKLISLIISLLILFLIYLFSSFIPRSYAYIYKISDYLIVEKYNKQGKYYTFEISDNNEKYLYSVLEEYHRKRGLINDINEKDNCLSIKSKDIDNFMICKDNGIHVSGFYDKTFDEESLDEYENILIYNNLDNKILVWNYNDFLYFNGKNKKHLKLFDTDVYELRIIAKINHYIVVADYNQKYYFNKLYLIDLKNGKIKETKLNRKVYFDSYILGTFKNNIYLFDNNKEIEYVINPFKSVIEKNAFEVLKNGKWEKVSLKQLKKQEAVFTEEKDFYFQVIEERLFFVTPSNKTLVTNMKVSRIIDSNKQEAYFISGDSLYYVNINKKIMKLMTYSEWIFNNQNIYIF